MRYPNRRIEFFYRSLYGRLWVYTLRLMIVAAFLMLLYSFFDGFPRLHHRRSPERIPHSAPTFRPHDVSRDDGSRFAFLLPTEVPSMSGLTRRQFLALAAAPLFAGPRALKPPALSSKEAGPMIPSAGTLQHVVDSGLLLMGAPGSGKTAMLCSLIHQAGNMMARAAPLSIDYVDLKGFGTDGAPFWTCYEAAQNAGVPFKFFTTRLGFSSFIFNPLKQRYQAALSQGQRVSALNRMIGLSQGDSWSAPYFAEGNYLVSEALFSSPEHDSFKKAVHALERGDIRIPANLLDIGKFSYWKMKRLATPEVINITPEDWCPRPVWDQRIDLTDSVTEPCINYFDLSSVSEPDLASVLAAMVLFGSLEARAVSHASHPDHQHLTIVDEAASLQNVDWSLFLQQSRSHNVGVLLTAQTWSQFNRISRDFGKLVDETFGTKIYLTIHDEDLQRIVMRNSGETLDYLYSDDTYGGMTRQEFVTDNIGRNEVLECNAYNDLAILHITPSKGGGPHHHYGGACYRIRIGYHTSLEAYVRKRDTPWPHQRLFPGTITPTPETANRWARFEPPRPRPAVTAEPESVRFFLEGLEQYQNDHA